jgi:hypothetical protein
MTESIQACLAVPCGARLLGRRDPKNTGAIFCRNEADDESSGLSKLCVPATAFAPFSVSSSTTTGRVWRRSSARKQ